MKIRGGVEEGKEMEKSSWEDRMWKENKEARNYLNRSVFKVLNKTILKCLKRHGGWPTWLSSIKIYISNVGFPSKVFPG